MKTKEKKELQEKTQEELKKMVADARSKLFSYRMEKEQGKLSDLRLMSKTKDDIARLLTMMQEKAAEEGRKHA